MTAPAPRPRPIPHGLDAEGRAVEARAASPDTPYACPGCQEPVRALQFQGGKGLWVHVEDVLACPFVRGEEPGPAPPGPAEQAATWLAAAIETREDLQVGRRCPRCGHEKPQALRPGGRVLRARTGAARPTAVGVHDEAGKLLAVITVATTGQPPEAPPGDTPWIAVAAADVLGALATGQTATLVPVVDHFRPWRCPGCAEGQG